MNITGIDLFCGIGGLTHGMAQAGIQVKAGFDIDDSCRYAYEANNKSAFRCMDITALKGDNLLQEYWNRSSEIKVLVGCAPCQPFSSHTNKMKGKKQNSKWNLLNSFLRLVDETDPHVVSMENVPNLAKHDIFKSFVLGLNGLGYNISTQVVYCPDYGIPQKRSRLVLLASKLGEISLIAPTHKPSRYRTTRDAIGRLPQVEGGERMSQDILHCTMKLTDINMSRIKQSKPNGSWRDWDEELLLNCHKKSSGKSYVSVYGRMSWNEPSPTITTQFYNYGTGRFGHPEQNRALTVREAALLQTFPKKYRFVGRQEDMSIKRLGIHIGNAVPVRLGQVIGRSIIGHVANTNTK